MLHESYYICTLVLLLLRAEDNFLQGAVTCNSASLLLFTQTMLSSDPVFQQVTTRKSQTLPKLMHATILTPFGIPWRQIFPNFVRKQQYFPKQFCSSRQKKSSPPHATLFSNFKTYRLLYFAA